MLLQYLLLEMNDDKKLRKIAATKLSIRAKFLIIVNILIFPVWNYTVRIKALIMLFPTEHKVYGSEMKVGDNRL